MTSSSTITITTTTTNMIRVMSQMMTLVPTKLSSSNNYMLWRDQIYPLIESLDLLNHVIPDAQHSAQVLSDNLAWKRTDLVLRTFIVGTLSEQVHSSVIGLDTAGQVWLSLETSYAKGAIPRESRPSRRMEAHLYHAAREGNIGVLRRKSLESELSCFVTPTGNTVLHIFITSQYPKLHMSHLSADTAREILNTCPSLQEQANDMGETPLHMAARYGHVHIAQVLLEYGGDGRVRAMLGKEDRMKETALHRAVRFNHSAVANLLIEQDPGFPYRANEAFETPLYLAAERGNYELVKMIVEKCQSPAYGGPIGRNALHAAAVRGDREMANIIVEKDGFKFLSKEVDQQGWTPLHYAAHFGHYKIVDDLLGHDAECAYIATIEGKETALHIAAKRDRPRLVEIFNSKCPDCFELVDARGRNVLHLAVESNARAVVNSLILDRSLGYLIDKRDEKGNTALHLLAASPVMPLSTHLLKSDSRVDKMAYNNNNMNVMDMAPTASVLRLEVSARKQLQRLGFKPGGRVPGKDKNINIGDGRKEVNTSNGDGESDLLREARSAHLVVAALIATVTFASGFTLPGGYINENGAKQGLAVLSKSRVFQAFVLLDSLAMVLSCVAVFLHIFLSMVVNRQTRLAMHEFAARFTMQAMVTMIVAFFCNVFAVLGDGIQPGNFSILACFVVVVPQVIQLYRRVFIGTFVGVFSQSFLWTVLKFKHYYCS